MADSTNLNDTLNAIDARLSAAQERLETRANSLGNSVALLQTRLDYTDRLIANHVEGSDKIVNADLNEEAANSSRIFLGYPAQELRLAQNLAHKHSVCYLSQNKHQDPLHNHHQSLHEHSMY